MNTIPEEMIPYLVHGINAMKRVANVLAGPREYRTVPPGGTPETLESDLNKLGKEGFRVVGVTETSVILERALPRGRRSFNNDLL